ncbi:MAG: gamma-glutamyl-gamma-aminobutyrate hydrolase family protein [Aquincola tertiaricarbonis]
MPDLPSAPVASTKPLLIGLSARIYHPTTPVPSLGGVFTRTLHYLEQSVAHWVMSREVLGVMIPAVESESLVRRSDMSLRHYADMLDGLVLQGGTDVSPETYGETPMKPAWAGDRVRDLYEMELLDAFISAGKPVLGICRGCQLLNVAFGGSLYQDIPTQLPGALRHHDENTYERQFHRVSLVRGTRLAGLYPDRSTGAINSIHHQSVKTLGHDLEVEALAIPDGVVEAIRWKGPSYVFGMQWHPEFMALNRWHDDQLDGSPILDDFLSAVRARKAQ